MFWIVLLLVYSSQFRFHTHHGAALNKVYSVWTAYYLLGKKEKTLDDLNSVCVFFPRGSPHTIGFLIVNIQLVDICNLILVRPTIYQAN